MDKFFHIRILVGIIVGLSLTHLLKGIVLFIENPTRRKIYFVHVLWAAYLLLLILHFWWWEFGFSQTLEWSFLNYLYVVVYTIFFFADAAILFPEDMIEYTGYKDYFYSRRKWFFSILALIYAMDLVDTALKGPSHLEYLGVEYFIGAGLGILGCLIAILVRNERFHAIFVTAVILYRISWIYRYYDWLNPR